jgi:uncharacterized membrane protein YdjX (TVP38/TMEM64 family)
LQLNIKKTFLFSSLVIIFLVLVWFLGRPFFQWLVLILNPESIKLFLEETGPLAPFVFILLQALQVVLAPIPMQVVGLAGGYMFGSVLGTLYSMIGLTIGTASAVWLARVFGRKLVEKFVDAKTLYKFDHLVERSGLMVFFLIFLLPALPDDAICFIAGLSTLRIGSIVFVAVLGRLPGLFYLTIVGEQFRNGLSTAVTIMILTSVVLILGLIFIFRDKIEALFSRKEDDEDAEENAEDQHIL